MVNLIGYDTGRLFRTYRGEFGVKGLCDAKKSKEERGNERDEDKCSADQEDRR